MQRTISEYGSPYLVVRHVTFTIGGYFMYVIFAAAVFLTCSQQHVVDVLAVASLGNCSTATAAA